MRVVSNITCIFAIIAQIFLSSIAFAHDLTCKANFSKAASEQLDQSGLEVTASHTDSCGCCHHSQNVANDQDADQPPSKTSSEEPFFPNTPCSCSSDTGVDFTLSEYSIETRERKIALFPAPLEYTLSYSYHSLLPRSEYANVGLPSLVSERIRVLYLPEYSRHYLSTHLSKFTI